jgi:hypothetical protein
MYPEFHGNPYGQKKKITWDQEHFLNNYKKILNQEFILF